MSRVRRGCLSVGLALAVQAPWVCLSGYGASQLDHPAQVSDLARDAYIIGPGDKLNLKVFSAPELSSVLPVLSDGTVSLPLLGSVSVAGLTLQQATYWIGDLLSQELLRPDLQLTLESPRPMQISIIGQVQRPGLYVMGQGNQVPSASVDDVVEPASGLPTLVSAIQKAGGITQQADLREVRLQRRLPGVNPRYKLARFNLHELLFKGNQTQNPFLFDGDVIEVALADETPQEAVELATVNLSPSTISVNIIGEVDRPGILSIRANTPLSQAIMMAGGTNEWRANRGSVELIRLNRNGSVTSKSFRLDLSASASNTVNPPLRDGDIVRVKRNLLAKGSDVVDGVSRPLTGLVTIWSLVKIVGNTSN